jgi:hypothetical protein
MASFTINESQSFTFSYVNATAGLYIQNVPDNIGLTNNFDGTYSFQVDVAVEIGITNFAVMNALNVQVDTITLTVIKKVPDEVHELCLAEINQLFPLPAPPSGTWVFSGSFYPDYISLLPFGNGIIAVSIAGQVTTLNLMFQTTTNPLSETYLVQIVISSCLTEYNFCSPYRIPVLWLNPAGGWSSYCFKGRKTFGVTIGDSRQFKTTNRIEKHYSRSRIYDTIGVLSGEIPVSHAAFLKSLKYSIQAYVISTVGYLPMLLDEKDFVLYEEGNGLMTYNLNLKLATEINIQTQ